MNQGNQHDFLSKKRDYPKHYDDDRSRERERPRERMNEPVPYGYHKFPSHQLREYPQDDMYSRSLKPEYKRKEPHYIRKDSSKEPPKKSYSELDAQSQKAMRKRDDDGYEEPRERRLYSYILLPRNYYKYITKSFMRLRDDLYDRIQDISDIQYDYSIPHFHEYVFRYSTETIASRALAIRIISEYLFNEMRDNFQNMTYLKVSILIPDHVIGFIIGIEGKNINRIRDETGAKIEVFQKNSSKKYRQIELSGSPRSIARASEKIFSIALKYNNFNHDTRTSRSRSSSQYESRRRSNHDHDHSRPYKQRYVNDYHMKQRDNGYAKEEQFNYINQQEPQVSYIDNSKKEEGEADIIIPQPKQYQPQPKKDYPPPHSLSHSRSHSSSPSMPKQSNPPNNQPQPPSPTPTPLIPEDSAQLPQPSLPPSSGVLSSGDLTKLFKKSADQGEASKEKSSLEVIFSSASMNLLKQCKSNIWIDLENNYHCTVSKRTQKSTNDDLSIITFIGTPEENTLALYQLQKYLIDSSYSAKSTN